MVSTVVKEKIRLTREEYKEIEDIFLDNVEDSGFTHFPINPFRLAKRMGVELVNYCDFFESLQEEIIGNYMDGFSRFSGTKYYIFYNDLVMEERMCFTLFYELAHIALGHLDGSSKTTDARKQQAECNHFAVFALAPMPLVIKAKPKGIEDIICVFGVSFNCASYVWNNYCAVMQYPAMAQKIANSRITRLLDFNIDECKRRYNAV